MKKCNVCGKSVLSGRIVCKECSNKLIDTFKDRKIIVEKAPSWMSKNDSFYIYFADKAGSWNMQDICCIQKDKATGKIHVIVWGDSDSEDYTHDITVDVYRDPKERECDDF